MADGVNCDIESALNVIVQSTEQSGNMKRELKTTIYETVSTLRTLLFELKTSAEKIACENNRLKAEMKEVESELEARKVMDLNRSSEHGVTSVECRQTLGGGSAHHASPSVDHSRKLYSEVLIANKEKRFKLIVKSKNKQPAESVKQLLKSKVNPAEIKVGINTLKTLRDGRLLIESSSRNEIEVLSSNIISKCGEEVEVNIPKLRRPRLIMYNIPDDITIDNAAGRIAEQNPELNLNSEDIQPKFCYTTKSNKKNLVVEVSPQVRHELLQTKIKLGWLIFKAQDYIAATRCFKCSRYNHRYRECRGEDTCPFCAGAHKMKECTVSAKQYKCINCVTYNKHTRNAKICENHSSLDKSCPSLQAVLEKYIQNTDY